MSYEASFKPTFFKDLKKLPQKLRQKLELIVETIRQDPFQIKTKKLAGHSGLFRYRLGDYRLVYYLDQKNKKILFLMVSHRKEVYKFIKKNLN